MRLVRGSLVGQSFDDAYQLRSRDTMPVLVSLGTCAFSLSFFDHPNDRPPGGPRSHP